MTAAASDAATEPGDAPQWLRRLAAAAAVMDVPRVVRPPAAGGRPAAVLVLFGDGPDGPDLLYIQKNEGLRRHSGQPAFPGGKVEDSDEGPVATALREAAEETGLDPAGVEVLATLPELFVAASQYRVIPVLAWWREPSAVRPVDIGEIAAVERISMATLADPANRIQLRFPSGRSGPAFRLNSMLIWGFTGLITDRLLALGGWERPWDTTPVDGLAQGAVPTDYIAPSLLGGSGYRGPVRGDLLDLALVVLAVVFAVSGYRQGFIVGSLSFIGFVGGAILGAEFGPAISRAIVGGATQRDVVAVVLLVSFAIIGQFIASSIGTYLRQSMRSRSTTTIDSVGGSAVSILSMLLIAWAIGSVLTASSFPVVVSQVDDSAVLTTLDRIMPSQARTMFSEFRQLLASGPFPQVFSGIGADHLFAVAAPDPAVVQSPGFLAARNRVVKINGTAPACDRSIEGSGFVYAENHILTNAHVVAGVSGGPMVTIPGRAQPVRAQVVFYDPQVDIAVLYVPGLDLTPLKFDNLAQAGDSAVVAGYPLDQPFDAQAARIGGTQDAVGPDIYQTGQVDREIYEIRANVRPGNSGGPLLSPAGQVYGVVFAAAVGTADTGFALTANEVAADARAGEQQSTPVSTGNCD